MLKQSGECETHSTTTDSRTRDIYSKAETGRGDGRAGVAEICIVVRVRESGWEELPSAGHVHTSIGPLGDPKAAPLPVLGPVFLWGRPITVTGNTT